eukprot:scaffold14848_cov62-Phaeocystis_antarctica.AAC.2
MLIWLRATEVAVRAALMAMLLAKSCASTAKHALRRDALVLVVELLGELHHMHDRDADAPDDPGVLLLEPLLVAGRGGEALEVGRPVGLRRVEEEVALQAAVLGGRRRRRPRRGDPRHRRRGRHPLRRRFAHRGGTRMQRLGRDLDDG